ncbi:ferritin family protein [Flavobacterium sangjuense]|nr:hypothetical protein [Flavobacterium sangjuense]
MKNRASNFLTRTSHDQVKSMADKKKHFATKALCEEAMNELKKIYWHEKQLLVVVPILMRSATTFELVESLTLLSDYTGEHINLLESKFPEINKIPKIKKAYKAVTYENIV